MSPEMCVCEEADDVRPAEGNTSAVDRARTLRLLRGQRPWHVTQPTKSEEEFGMGQIPEAAKEVPTTKAKDSGEHI
jgi:hypothetical protein